MASVHNNLFCWWDSGGIQTTQWLPPSETLASQTRPEHRTSFARVQTPDGQGIRRWDASSSQARTPMCGTSCLVWLSPTLTCSRPNTWSAESHPLLQYRTIWWTNNTSPLLRFPQPLPLTRCAAIFNPFLLEAILLVSHLFMGNRQEARKDEENKSKLFLNSLQSTLSFNFLNFLRTKIDNHSAELVACYGQFNYDKRRRERPYYQICHLSSELID